MLSLDKTPPLRNLTVLPLMLSPERDEDLLRLTENRVPAFTHDLVPDYLRTKPEPEVETKMVQLELKAANLSFEAAQVSIRLAFFICQPNIKIIFFRQKQVAAYTKVVNHIYEIVSKAREEWETETSSRTGAAQTSSMADTHALVAAIGIGKGLKTMPGAPPGMMVAPVGPGRPPGPSQQAQQIGPLGGKAPSSIKTNIKSGGTIHPYGR